ncbi:Bor family protein [Olivibacter sitiensis]|uniref:Bor family protein n=1 Tax=Olivibacter sitiensis TaxID=376470 RepID=UPI000481FA8E|nr:Bor family protein [Olivibacter sitiensis]
MRRKLFNLALAGCLSMLMTSCYTYTYTVGSGPKSGQEVKAKNHYLIYGLAPLKTTSPVVLAGDSKDYEVTLQHTFVDGLINAITFGIYNPTTTTVKK